MLRLLLATLSVIYTISSAWSASVMVYNYQPNMACSPSLFAKLFIQRITTTKLSFSLEKDGFKPLIEVPSIPKYVAEKIYATLSKDRNFGPISKERGNPIQIQLNLDGIKTDKNLKIHLRTSQYLHDNELFEVNIKDFPELKKFVEDILDNLKKKIPRLTKEYKLIVAALRLQAPGLKADHYDHAFHTDPSPYFVAVSLKGPSTLIKHNDQVYNFPTGTPLLMVGDHHHSLPATKHARPYNDGKARLFLLLRFEER